jgi:hypothetical protein
LVGDITLMDGDDDEDILLERMDRLFIVSVSLGF